MAGLPRRSLRIPVPAAQARLACVVLFAIFAIWSPARAQDAASRLLAAAAQGDSVAVGTALADGAPVDSRDRNGRTALLIATYGNYPVVARALIARGADVNAKDSIEDSPFLSAGAEGRVEILKMTLAAGADLRSLNRFGGTALIPAAHHGHVEAVRVLLDTAIDRDHINRLGWTALLEAVILGDGGPTHRQIVDLLLRAGAKADIADREGVTPLEHAHRRGYHEIAQMLERAGAR